MSKDSYYIKLDSNSYDDPKVKVLRARHGNMWAFGGFVFLALKMRQESNHELEYSDITFEALSIDMGKSAEEVKQFVDEGIRVGLFQRNETHFYSDRLKRDMAFLQEKRDKASMAGKISADKRYGKTSEQVSPKADTTIAEMIELYEQKTGRTLIPNDYEVLKDIDDNYSSEDFEKAVEQAVNNKAKAPMRYIAKTLENWKQEKQSAKPVRRTYDDGKNTEGMEVL